MQERIDEVKGALCNSGVSFGAKQAEPKDVNTYAFKHDPKDFKVYWDVRKGLIPIVGGARETGNLQFITSWCSNALLGSLLKCHGLFCCSDLDED